MIGIVFRGVKPLHCADSSGIREYTCPEHFLTVNRRRPANYPKPKGQDMEEFLSIDDLRMCFWYDFQRSMPRFNVPFQKG